MTAIEGAEKRGPRQSHTQEFYSSGCVVGIPDDWRCRPLSMAARSPEYVIVLRKRFTKESLSCWRCSPNSTKRPLAGPQRSRVIFHPAIPGLPKKYEN